MTRVTTARLAVLTLTLAVVAGCGLGSDEGGTTSTLPTLPPSLVPTTPSTTTAPPTAPTTAPPLTAPVGGPNTLPPIPGLATTVAPATTASARITYVAEPASGALRLGHRGTRVQAMQGQLVALGYQLGVDGYFGRGTESAVRQFQQANGFPADGIAGPSTLDRLAQVAPAG
jgi:hypothetical protein